MPGLPLRVILSLAATAFTAAGCSRPILLVLWQAVAQGRVHLAPEVRDLLCHLVERWHDLVCSQRHPTIPASTNRLEGWFGRFKPRARLPRGLKTEAGLSTSCA